VKELEIHTPAGLYLGRSGSYEVDVDRLCRVARRTTLGLFFRETGRRLAPPYEATTYLPSTFDEHDRQAYDETAAPMVRTLLADAPRFVGRRVLSYRWKAAADDPNATLWLLLFYDRVLFVSITTPTAGKPRPVAARD
jgi:hypothetical protein